ncbi:MFS transporter [Salinivibrio proteolyticus]|uniref:MFS transporter n=1 Tax=Salinivibrio proteolyticus TaxID=334715 RepID=UPI00098939BA|nr:MFS transporter [Salinivibrio proteolyticus]OOF22472.1 MFS transporter [Salinivibrio proteolyticus]
MASKFILALLFCTAFLVGADELLLGPILQPIGHDLGVPPERVTLFVTAYSVSIAIVAPYLGRLSDRYGRMSIMRPACFLFGVASISTGLVNQFDIGLVTRVITGLASAGMLPIAFAIAGDQPHDRAMKHIAFVQAGLTLGMITSPAIGALLTDLISWRFAFIALGVMALVLGCLLCTHRHSHYARRKSTPEPLGFVHLLQVPGTLGALVAMGVGLGGGIGVFNLLGQRLRDATELDIAWVGVTYAGLGIVSVIGNLLMSRVVRRLGNGRVSMRAALVVCLLSSVWVFSLPAANIVLFIPVLICWSLAGGVGSPALQSYIAELSVQHRGALMAMGMSMMHLGVAIWSGLAGLAYTYGSSWVALLSTCLFLTAIVALRPVFK